MFNFWDGGRTDCLRHFYTLRTLILSQSDVSRRIALCDENRVSTSFEGFLLRLSRGLYG
jgi:hypothetical protein